MSRLLFDMLEVNIAMAVIIPFLCLLAGKLRKRYGAVWMKWVWFLLAVRLVIPYNFSLPFTEIRLLNIPGFEQEESLFPDEGYHPFVNSTQSVASPETNADSFQVEKTGEVNHGTKEDETVKNDTEGEMVNNETGKVETVKIEAGKDETTETEAAGEVAGVDAANRDMVSQTSAVSETDGKRGTNSFYSKVMTGIWVLGIVFVMLYYTFCYMYFSFKCKNNLCAVTDQEVERKLIAVQKKFVRKPLPVYQSRSIASPMLIGILSPKLVVPAVRKQWSETEMEMLVAHEICHYRKKDVLLKLFITAASCINWFNPTVYLMKRQFFYDVELACDDCVLSERSGEEREVYARMMLVFARKTKHATAFSTGFGESKERMKKRIDYMLDSGRKKKGFLCIALVGVVMMTMSVFISCGYKPYEGDGENVVGQTDVERNDVHENLIQERVEAEGIIQEEEQKPFDYNHEYNQILRCYKDNIYLAEPDGIYCVNENGAKELIYENIYQYARGMEIYQEFLYFCGSAQRGEKEAATIYRMNLDTYEVEDELAVFSQLFDFLYHISIYDDKLYVASGYGKRIGFELNENGQIYRQLDETAEDFLYREYNDYVDLEVQRMNVAYDSEEYWTLVEERNQRYVPVMDVAACKKLLQGKQVVSRYKDEMYRSIYLEEAGAYEYLCDTLYGLPLLVTNAGVYYASGERGDISYVDYATKTVKQLYMVERLDEAILVNFDADYIYLIRTCDVGLDENNHWIQETYLTRVPREGGESESVYQLEDDLLKNGPLIQCGVYENYAFFELHDTIRLEGKME